MVVKNYGPFLGYPKYQVPYDNGDPKGTIILITTHMRVIEGYVESLGLK